MNALIITEIPEENEPLVFVSSKEPETFVKKAKAMFQKDCDIERNATNHGIDEANTFWDEDADRGVLAFRDGSRNVYECTYTSDLDQYHIEGEKSWTIHQNR